MFIVNLIKAAFDLITIPFRFIWENCKDVIISVWNVIKNTVTSVLKAIANFIKPILTGIKNLFSQKMLFQT